jgi:hypothetical protein
MITNPKQGTGKLNRTLKPWLMLACRPVLFLGFQTMIALSYWFGESTEFWKESEAWWPITVILSNLICLILLIRFYHQDGMGYWDIFRIQRQYLKTDSAYLLGFLLIAGPLGYLPNVFSARWLFGDPQVALNLLVRPLPVWATLISLILFPLLQGLVEIPTYMLYTEPHLEAQGLRPAHAIGLVSLFLAAQHIFAPFIPDARFIIYRLVMFLPFAVLVAMVMRARPRLMPFMAGIHILMDLSVAVMFLPAMT